MLPAALCPQPAEMNLVAMSYEPTENQTNLLNQPFIKRTDLFFWKPHMHGCSEKNIEKRSIGYKK